MVRAELPVDQPGLMDRHQTGRGADRERLQAGLRQRPIAPDGLGEGRARHVLGHEVGAAALDACVQDSGHA